MFAAYKQTKQDATSFHNRMTQELTRVHRIKVRLLATSGWGETAANHISTVKEEQDKAATTLNGFISKVTLGLDSTPACTPTTADAYEAAKEEIYGKHVLCEQGYKHIVTHVLGDFKFGMPCHCSLF